MSIDRISFARKAVPATSTFLFSQNKTTQKRTILVISRFPKTQRRTRWKTSNHHQTKPSLSCLPPSCFTSPLLTTHRSTPHVYTSGVQGRRVAIPSVPPAPHLMPPPPSLKNKKKLNPAPPFLSSTVSSPSHTPPPRPLHRIVRCFHLVDPLHLFPSPPFYLGSTGLSILGIM